MLESIRSALQLESIRSALRQEKKVRIMKLQDGSYMTNLEMPGLAKYAPTIGTARVERSTPLSPWKLVKNSIELIESQGKA